MTKSGKYRSLAFTVALAFAFGSVSAAGVRGAEDTKQVKANELTLQVPKDWVEEKPSSRLRLAQIRVPGENKQDAELSIFNFGASDPGANVRRWIGQYEPQGRTVKVFSGDAKLGKYVLVDLTGTYKKAVGPPVAGKTELVKNSGTLAVMLLVDGAKVYYLKLNGPQETVAARRNALRASFGADASKEEAVKFNVE